MAAVERYLQRLSLELMRRKKARFMIKAKGGGFWPPAVNGLVIRYNGVTKFADDLIMPSQSLVGSSCIDHAIGQLASPQAARYLLVIYSAQHLVHNRVHSPPYWRFHEQLRRLRESKTAGIIVVGDESARDYLSKGLGFHELKLD